MRLVLLRPVLVVAREQADPVAGEQAAQQRHDQPGPEAAPHRRAGAPGETHHHQHADDERVRGIETAGRIVADRELVEEEAERGHGACAEMMMIGTVMAEAAGRIGQHHTDDEPDHEQRDPERDEVPRGAAQRRGAVPQEAPAIQQDQAARVADHEEHAQFGTGAGDGEPDRPGRSPLGRRRIGPDRLEGHHEDAEEREHVGRHAHRPVEDHEGLVAEQKQCEHGGDDGAPAEHAGPVWPAARKHRTSDQRQPRDGQERRDQRLLRRFDRERVEV